MPRRSALLACLLLLLVPARGIGQVQVAVRLEQPQYLAGEPVWVTVAVKNVGDEAVGYSGCDADVKLAVPGGTLKAKPKIMGCFGGMGGFVGCAIDHPPLLLPGRTTTFRYLLRGYKLGPGEYDLRVSGKAGVRWYYPETRPNASPTVPPAHRETDPVDGRMFDTTLRFVVVPGNEESLRRAFEPYVKAVNDLMPSESREAREAIAEMAPPSLERTIADLVKKRLSVIDDVPANAIDALAEINTVESRQDLRDIHDASDNLRLRASVVSALATTGAPDNLPFFQTLLPGRETVGDNLIRRFAAYGIGYIHGDDAVEALRGGPFRKDPLVRDAMVTALGNTQARSAVPVLIDAAKDVRDLNAVCGALITLTHRTWCDGSGDLEAARRRWHQWWDANGPTAPIFGVDQCPATTAGLPLVR
jgi:hypothetical protein